jgi:SseB protein N-terminal domain/SseB protein C-terminal domain
MLVAAAQDPAERPAFAHALLASEVYVLGDLDTPTVDGVAQPGTGAKLVNFSDAEGQFHPFFTSEAALQSSLAVRTSSSPNYLRLGCRQLFEMTKGARLVLNPDNPYGKQYLPAEIASLLTRGEPGMNTIVVTEPMPVRTGAAAHLPSELPATIARFFAQRPTVDEARIGWIAYPDGHKGYLMVVVTADREASMAGFGAIQVGELTDGNTFDVMIELPGTAESKLLQIPPFYVRQPQADLPTQRRGLFRRK